MGEPALALLAARTGRTADRALFFFAHPDDETIGAGATLAGQPTSWVVHATEGAPRSAELRPPGCGQADYARIRRAELVQALALAGIPADHTRMLGAIDQEVAFSVHELAVGLVRWLVRAGTEVLVTHPYEGGHPDHDACALVASAAIELVGRRTGKPPLLVEAAFYHAASGGIARGDFLAGTGPTPVFERLEEPQRERKRAMIAAFPSQREVLESFDPDREGFRLAPKYDFTRPPHEGPLLYERLGWPLTGERWRHLARRAMTTLGLEGRACG